MSPPESGEVWLADLGLAAKTRPVPVVSVPFADRDYALIRVGPHTNSGWNIKSRAFDTKGEHGYRRRVNPLELNLWVLRRLEKGKGFRSQRISQPGF